MRFIKGKRISCDVETTGVRPWRGDRAFAFSFANTHGDTAYFEFPVDPRTRAVDYRRALKVPAGVTPRGAFRALKKFFRNRKVLKVFHNAKFDIRMCDFAGIKVRGAIGDTEFKLRICDATRQTYELKPVCDDLFGIKKTDQQDLAKAVNTLRNKAKRLGYAVASKGTHGDAPNAADYWMLQHAKRILLDSLKFLKTYQNASPAGKKRQRLAARKKARAIAGLCERYAVQDAERTIVLDMFLEPLLDEYGVRHIYDEELKEIFPVVYAIETRGVWLDKKLVKSGRRAAVKELKKHRKRIIKLCDEAESKLNPKTFPNSFPQKVQYFINELGLEPLHYSKTTNNPKLDKTFLEFYEADVPMCGAIQGEGKCSKAIGTYFDNYRLMMVDEGIIHGSLQQIGGLTGRFSMRDPNLQNVPKRAECPRCHKTFKIAGWKGERAICKECGKASPLDVMMMVRRPFGPRPGCVWYAYDFQQIEARIFADEADEKFMLKAFKRGEDVYQKFADVIADATGFDISRQHTKSIFLGKLYGLGLKKLIKSIMDAMHGKDVDESDARDVIQCFDDSFPGVSEFMQDTIRRGRADGFVTNRYGQRIDVLRDFAYRGVNYLIQSSAARLMKRAMVKTYKYLQSIGFGWLVMTIHDELIFEFETNNRPRKVIQTLADLMADNDGMFDNVSTPVECSKIVGSWLEPADVDWVVCS